MAFAAALLGSIAGLAASLIAYFILDYSLLASVGIFEACGATVAFALLTRSGMSQAVCMTAEMPTSSART